MSAARGGRWQRVLVVVFGAIAVAGAQERSVPVDCFPDGVPRWEAAEPDPGARYGAGYVPGILVGPPGPSAANTGSTTVASLGYGGSMVYVLTDLVIEDRPGPDFIVFENGFFQGVPPASEEEDYRLYTEPGFVDVSVDGQTWERFPYDAEALALASGGGEVGRELHRRLAGLAGVTPTFSGNWTVPDDPWTWDPDGQGGVSGAGGDAFDLADVGLDAVQYVRLTDTGSLNGLPGSGEGFDVDALVVLHGRPLAPATADADGDGLSDEEEEVLFGTLPGIADSDGDGTDDGREVAGCRDPGDGGDAPWWLVETRVWLRHAPGCTEVRWSRVGEGLLYDVERGDVTNLRRAGGVVDLGPTTCVEAGAAAWRSACEAGLPLPGEAWFYVVTVDGEGAPGRSSALEPRQGGGSCD